MQIISEIPLPDAEYRMRALPPTFMCEDVYVKFHPIKQCSTLLYIFLPRVPMEDRAIMPKMF